MRRLFFALAALAFSACGPDLLIGTYDFNVAGTDTQTAPLSGSNTVSGTGTLAITTGKSTDYLVTLAHLDTDPCVLKAEANDKGDLITIGSGQTCTFTSGGNTTTATVSSGRVEGSEKGETVSVSVQYGYTATVFGVNFVGTGTRTYTGIRR